MVERTRINIGGPSGEPTFIDPADSSGSGTGDSANIRDSAGTAFDPERHVAPGKLNSDGTFRNKRGRRKGSGKSSKVHRDLEGSIEGLTKGLAIFHMVLASATKAPELILDDEEAKGLASATVNVLELYDIRPDPKVEAIVTLIAVSAATYAPRIAAIRMRKEQEAKERKANASGEGVAGVYSATGEPAGTAHFNVVN